MSPDKCHEIVYISIRYMELLQEIIQYPSLHTIAQISEYVPLFRHLESDHSILVGGGSQKKFGCNPNKTQPPPPWWYTC